MSPSKPPGFRSLYQINRSGCCVGCVSGIVLVQSNETSLINRIHTGAEGWYWTCSPLNSELCPQAQVTPICLVLIFCTGVNFILYEICPQYNPRCKEEWEISPSISTTCPWFPLKMSLLIAFKCWHVGSLWRRHSFKENVQISRADFGFQRTESPKTNP